MNIGYSSAMITNAKSIDRGYRFPADVIQQAVWLYFRFPLSLWHERDAGSRERKPAVPSDGLTNQPILPSCTKVNSSVLAVQQTGSKQGHPGHCINAFED
jgi:hypothetical protein